MSYKPTRTELLEVVRPLLRDATTCRDAFLGAHRLADVARTAGLLAEASPHGRPSWYREDRRGDRYLTTLDSGEVLAFARFAEGEPQELMAWRNSFSGSVIWRERDPATASPGR